MQMAFFGDLEHPKTSNSMDLAQKFATKNRWQPSHLCNFGMQVRITFISITNLINMYLLRSDPCVQLRWLECWHMYMYMYATAQVLGTCSCVHVVEVFFAFFKSSLPVSSMKKHLWSHTEL